VALSLRAAREARLSTAFEMALDILVASGPLLDADAWTTDHEAMLARERERMELEYLVGDRASALARFASALARARNDVERVELYLVKIGMETARAEFREAVASAREALELVGVHMPRRPGRAAIVRELALLRYRQGRRTVEDLARLPECPDERSRCAAQLLTKMTLAAYLSDPLLMSLAMLKIANMSLKNGVTADSAYGFVGYGVVLAGSLGAYRKGYELGRLAVRLNDRFDNTAAEAYIHHTAGSLLTPWVRPFAEAIEQLAYAQKMGMETGDMQSRIQAANFTVALIELSDRSFGDVIGAARSAYELASRHGDRNLSTNLDMRLRFLRCLRGECPDPTELSDERSSDSALRASLSDERTPFSILRYYLYKAVLQYHFGSIDEAWRHIGETQPRERAVFASPALVPCVFYRVLIAAELLVAGTTGQRRSLSRVMATGLTRLSSWARACPENFAARHLLARAEAARAHGRHDDAMADYRAAIAGAARAGAAGIEALAHELAARCGRASGHTVEAAEHDAGAIDAYRRWGALAKADRLARARAHAGG
jgi:predicted ATPase